MPQHPVQPPEWIDSAPSVADASIDIGAPPGTVWTHVSDHERWPEWFSSLKAVEPLGEPTGVGGGRRVTVGRMKFDEEFTAWDENEHFAFSVIKTSLPFVHTIAESVRLDETDSGCRVTYRQGLRGKLGFGWVIKLVANRAQGQLRDALGNLKTIVESSDDSS